MELHHGTSIHVMGSQRSTSSSSGTAPVVILI